REKLTTNRLLDEIEGAGSHRLNHHRAASPVDTTAAPVLDGRCPPQSPAPGLGEKYWSLSGFPSHSLESGGGAFFAVMFGQIFAYSAFSRNHFSSPESVSGLIASTGHSGTQTPQSMHSSGWITSMFSPS